MFGGTLGFNAQYGNFVFGLEGDVSGNWMRDSNSSGTGICAAPGCAIQTSWFATARGRIGYAFDRALFYVTAGGAFGERRVTADGFETTIQVNHLAPFLLTHLLLDRLDGGRVVNTASDAHTIGRLDPADLNSSRGSYRMFPVYGGSKQANIAFAAEAARRWPGPARWPGTSSGRRRGS
jgi:NAD(P)-dependent dehydrogenase (short-subunit alcohol dehydrogenase family)